MVYLDPELDLEAADKAALDPAFLPYVFRLGRALCYGMASYFLLWLQPHFTFSYTAFALAVFFLSLGKRSLPVGEIAVLILVLAVFVPEKAINLVAQLL